MTKKVIALLLTAIISMNSFATLLLMERSNSVYVKFDYDVFPFDYGEPHYNASEDYEQLFAGEYLTWTSQPVEEIEGMFIVHYNAITYGAVCHFISIRHDNEWLIVGYVSFSDGTRNYYCKWQTFYEEFTQENLPIAVQDGDWVGVAIYKIADTWTAELTIPLRGYIYFSKAIKFHNHIPNEVFAGSKSLSGLNTMDGDFLWLKWTNTRMYYWGFESKVGIRHDEPYGVIVVNAFYDFKTFRPIPLTIRSGGSLETFQQID